MEKLENKVVLTGTYEGSYGQFRKRHAKIANKRNSFSVIKLFLKRLKRKKLWKM